jgi:hypothetical protein
MLAYVVWAPQALIAVVRLLARCRIRVLVHRGVWAKARVRLEAWGASSSNSRRGPFPAGLARGGVDANRIDN